MSTSSNRGIEVLQGLGLTQCQAKIYLALCHFGWLDAKTISKHTHIARQDVYRVIADLERLRLIEKLISRPTKIRAIPLKKGVSFLLKQKHRELNTITSQTKSLLDEFNANKEEQMVEKAEFVWVPSKEAIIYKIQNAIENAQSSINIVSSYKRISKISMFSEALEGAWSRGVKCQIIIDKPEKNRASDEILNFLSKNACCEVKFLPSAPETVMTIYDRKEILIITDPNARLSDSPALWSNNLGLISGMWDYFTILWTTALEEPTYNIDSEEIAAFKL
ncbi:MAG: helix-turn-helix domain-containing protein [Candidatus Bathyarchaeota archaeon]|jgi:sugar-specific transcriptional regulator TrmB